MFVMIIERENLKRMVKADPLDFKPRLGPLPAAVLASRVQDLDIVLAYEEDEAKIADLAKRNDFKGLIDWVERGRTFDPALGDGGAPEVIGTFNLEDKS